MKKKIIYITSFIFCIILICLLVLIIFEYRPKEREKLKVEGKSTKVLELNENVKLITYNLGYLSLDKTQDFFMDGGSGVMPNDSSNVKRNLKGVKKFINEYNADIYFFQEVDTSAKRSYNINEYNNLKEDFDGTSSFAYMFKSLFIPYPITNPVGHVESGNATLNKFDVISATRIKLPDAYKFPMSVVMYKNPILEERVKINNSSKELVLYNIHLDAYGGTDGKSVQLNVLLENMKEEVNKGNYVIAGGDFNQIFPDADLEKFPLVKTDNFLPGKLENDLLPNDWKFVTDYTYPTSRLLDKPYSGNYKDTQLYIIDGFIIGPNIKVENVETIENNFEYSDHQPVKMEFKLI